VVGLALSRDGPDAGSGFGFELDLAGTVSLDMRENSQLSKAYSEKFMADYTTLYEGNPATIFAITHTDYMHGQNQAAQIVGSATLSKNVAGRSSYAPSHTPIKQNMFRSQATEGSRQIPFHQNASFYGSHPSNKYGSYHNVVPDSLQGNTYYLPGPRGSEEIERVTPPWGMRPFKNYPDGIELRFEMV